MSHHNQPNTSDVITCAPYNVLFIPIGAIESMYGMIHLSRLYRFHVKCVSLISIARKPVRNNRFGLLLFFHTTQNELPDKKIAVYEFIENVLY